MLPHSTKSETVQRLEKQMLALQGLSRPTLEQTIHTGLGAIERAFPGQCFPTAAIHEFISQETIDSAATTGFLAGLLSCLIKTQGVCLWVSTKRRTFPPALKAFRLNPEQIVFIDAKCEKEAFWTVEEGLKCDALVAVVGEFTKLDFTASRRLQLAVEQSKVTGFIHRFQVKSQSPVACASRWRIKPLSSIQNGSVPGIGFPKWHVELVKVRNGHPGQWEIEWTTKGFRELSSIKSQTLLPLPIQKTG